MHGCKERPTLSGQQSMRNRSASDQGNHTVKTNCACHVPEEGMDSQSSAAKHIHVPRTWSPRPIQLFLIFASFASPSLTELTSAPAFEGISSSFVNVNEESTHPPASHRLEIGKSGITIPLKELQVANVDEIYLHIDLHFDFHIHVNHQQSPDATSGSWSPPRKILGSHHNHARKLSERGRDYPPEAEDPPAKHQH